MPLLTRSRNSCMTTISAPNQQTASTRCSQAAQQQGCQLSPVLNEVRRQRRRLLALHLNLSIHTHVGLFPSTPCLTHRPASRLLMGATVQSQGKNPPYVSCNQGRPAMQCCAPPCPAHWPASRPASRCQMSPGTARALRPPHCST